MVDRHAAAAVVGVVSVVVALGIVQLLHLGVRHHVGVSALAVVNPGAAGGNAVPNAIVGGDQIAVAGCAANVSHEVVGQAAPRDFIHGAEGEAVAVGVDQVFVFPGLGLWGHGAVIQFAGRDQDLLFFRQGIAIDVGIEKFVVGADLLKLAVGFQQRARVPEANVAQGEVILLQIGIGERGGGIEGFDIDVFQIKGFSGQGDVMANVGLFPRQFVGLHRQLLDDRRQNHHRDRAQSQIAD